MVNTLKVAINLETLTRNSSADVYLAELLKGASNADNMMTEETSSSVLNGKFHFKRLDKTKVVCTYCSDELSFHRSTTSLLYHLRAKHIFAIVSKDASTETGSSSVHQTTLAECSQGKSVNNATTTKLTKANAKWIAIDCRPIIIVEDQEVQGIILIESDDQSYKPHSRGTIVTRIHELYVSEKATKAEQLAQATFIARETGDHWTSVEPSVSIQACPLQCWSAHTGPQSKLAHIAQRYLATPSSTVSYERLLSLAGHIVQERSALSSENKLVCQSNFLKEK